MSNTPLTETHHGTKIEYDEQDNTWKFTLRGWERSAASLRAAREIIDRPVKEKKATSFERVECYRAGWNNDWEPVTVTSIADTPYSYSFVEVWIVEKDKSRLKVRASGLYPVNDHNTALIKKIRAFDSQIEMLKNQRQQTVERMQGLKLPKDEEKE